MNEPLQIGIARIYVKDLSFESPRSPSVFTENWRPELKLDVGVRTQRVEDNLYEVVLEITATARDGANVGFIVEVEQAGLFNVKAPEPQLESILRVFCPTTLFPYARQTVDQALLWGGFPPLMLAPINFDSLNVLKH